MTVNQSPSLDRAIYLINSIKSLFKVHKILKYCGIFFLGLLIFVHFSKVGLNDYFRSHHLYLIIIIFFVLFFKIYITEIKDELLNNIIELEDIIEKASSEELDGIVKEIHQLFIPSSNKFQPESIIDILVLSTTFTKRQFISFPHPLFDILCGQISGLLAYYASIEQAHDICEKLGNNIEKLPSIDSKNFNIINKKNKTLRYIIVCFSLIYMTKHKDIDLLNKLNKMNLFNNEFINGDDDIIYLFMNSREKDIFHKFKPAIKDQFADILNKMPI